MNKDILSVSLFLVMIFTVSYGGHLLFKKGYASKWAMNQKIDAMQNEQEQSGDSQSKDQDDH